MRAKALKCRPSELVGNYNSIEAFYFDRAIWRWASGVEIDMDEAAENAGKGSKSPEKFKRAARLRVLDKALKTRGQPQKFKDPALGLQKQSEPEKKPKQEDKGIEYKDSDGDVDIVLEGFG